MMSVLRRLPGGAQLEEWFGYLPNFHDAEVVNLDLKRDPEPSILKVDAWHTSDEVDEDGYFRRDRRATIIFMISGIVQMEISDWNHQNVLSSLDVTENAEGYVIALNGTFGVDGRVVTKTLSIAVEPKL